MMYKLHIFCPDEPKVIEEVINAASDAGAGFMGNYSHTATISKVMGQWKSEEGAHPTIGKVGELTKQAEVKIEMRCPQEKAKAVSEAIRRVHPYEEPAIEFVKLEDV